VHRLAAAFTAACPADNRNPSSTLAAAHSPALSFSSLRTPRPAFTPDVGWGALCVSFFSCWRLYAIPLSFDFSTGRRIVRNPSQAPAQQRRPPCPILSSSQLHQGSLGPSDAKPAGPPEAVRAPIEKLGGKVHASFFAFGDFDVLAITEMPDTISAAAIFHGLRGWRRRLQNQYHGAAHRRAGPRSPAQSRHQWLQIHQLGILRWPLIHDNPCPAWPPAEPVPSACLRRARVIDHASAFPICISVGILQYRYSIISHLQTQLPLFAFPANSLPNSIIQINSLHICSSHLTRASQRRRVTISRLFAPPPRIETAMSHFCLQISSLIRLGATSLTARRTVSP